MERSSRRNIEHLHRLIIAAREELGSILLRGQHLIDLRHMRQEVKHRHVFLLIPQLDAILPSLSP